MKIKHLFPMPVTKNIGETPDFSAQNPGFERQGKYPEENPFWISLSNGNSEIAFNLPNEHSESKESVSIGFIYLRVENIDET